MWDIKGQIKSASEVLKINFKEIPASEVEGLRVSISSKYAENKKNAPLWENLTDNIGINNSEAWKWIGDFIGNSKVIMFFDTTEEKSAFEFNCGNDVVAVLSETYNFEFYTTNYDTQYLLCFNHHDVLIACGKAVDWLKNYSKQKESQILRY